MRHRILIVDSNQDILQFLSKVFKNDYQLHLARSGDEARHILNSESLELIISHTAVPGINGFELCRFVKSNIEYCHIPVVLLTDKNNHNTHIKGLEAGVDLYVQKPFSENLLKKQVANLLENRIKIKEHFAKSTCSNVRVMAHSKSDDIFLKKLNDYISRHITDPNLNVDQLADHMNMSRPTLYRKTKSLSAVSPKELIDVNRLKKATRLIAQNEFTMFEIASMVGYSSQSVFNKNFIRHFKQTPNQFRDSLDKPQAFLNYAH